MWRWVAALALRTVVARDSLETILERIVEPVFPDVTFDVLNYGALPDNATDALPAFAAALAAASAAGGGQVVASAPGRVFVVCGGLEVASNVRLLIGKRTTVRWAAERSCYLPAVLSKFEGTELFNYQPLIRAFGAENVSVVGADRTATLDGGGAGWPLKSARDAKRLRSLGAAGAPVEGRQFGGRGLPPSFLQPFRCVGVVLANFSLVNAPFWSVHPVASRNVVVRGLRVNTTGRPNTDGIDPEACVDVLVEDNFVAAGDDAIAVKTGRDADGWRLGITSANLVFRRNVLWTKFNGACVGSEVSGGVSNVFFLETKILRAFHGFYVKSNSARGSFVSDVFVRNAKAYDLQGDCVHFDSDYKGVGGDRPTQFERFLFRDVVCRRAVFAVFAAGLPDAPVADVTIAGLSLKLTSRTTPDHLVSHPISVANVRNWEATDVRVNGQPVALSNKATVAFRPYGD